MSQNGKSFFRKKVHKHKYVHLVSTWNKTTIHIGLKRFLLYRNLLKALLHVRIFMKNIPLFYYSSNILQGFTRKNID